MIFETADNVGSPGAANSGGSWKEIAPVLAISKDGPVYGRLETQAESGPQDRAKDVLRARRDAQRSADLLAEACHDFRQPLEVIMLALNRLGTTQTPATSVDWLSVAREELDSLAAGLTELARSARLTEPAAAWIPLSGLLRSAASTWRRHAALSGSRIVVVESGLSVKAEPRLLQTAVRHLIGDAVGHAQSGRILVGVRRRAAGVRIDVFGSRSGLDPDNAQRLDEQFRPDCADPDKLAPRLAVARDAAERLGAGLSLACLPGQVARLSLTLPLAR